MSKKSEKKMDSDGVVAEGVLGQVIVYKEYTRPGRMRVQQDFTYCPTMTEQHSAHLTDINYLIEKYKPDELAAYIAAKAQHRVEILGHDFSQEPSLQDARNVTYRLQQAYEALDPEVKMHFKNHVEFCKFIDNPANAEKMIKLGLMTKKEVVANQTTPPPTSEPVSEAKKA